MTSYTCSQWLATNLRRVGGLTNPAPGVLDFNDWRALQPMFDAAKLAGIFIVLRPGAILLF